MLFLPWICFHLPLSSAIHGDTANSKLLNEPFKVLCDFCLPLPIPPWDKTFPAGALCCLGVGQCQLLCFVLPFRSFGIPKGFPKALAYGHDQADSL